MLQYLKNDYKIFLSFNNKLFYLIYIFFLKINYKSMFKKLLFKETVVFKRKKTFFLYVYTISFRLEIFQKYA